jgi:uncharacterized protein (TIGR02996 family)
VASLVSRSQPVVGYSGPRYEACVPTEAECIAAIAAHPNDAAARLVYADLLEEAGDPRAEYLRAELEWWALRTGERAFGVALAKVDRRHYIATVKVLREVTRQGLGELKDLVDGVLAGEPRAVLQSVTLRAAEAALLWMSRARGLEGRLTFEPGVEDFARAHQRLKQLSAALDSEWMARVGRWWAVEGRGWPFRRLLEPQAGAPPVPFAAELVARGDAPSPTVESLFQQSGVVFDGLTFDEAHALHQQLRAVVPTKAQVARSRAGFDWPCGVFR